MPVKVYRFIPEVPLPGGPRCVGIGNFDGVHLGHQALVRQVREEAQAKKLIPLLITFDPPPDEVLQPQKAPERLIPLEDKIDALSSLGAEEILVIPTDQKFLATPAEDFASRILGHLLKSRIVIVGENFRFGQGRRGDPELLTAIGRERGFQVHQVPPVAWQGLPVSSTRVREALKEGKVELATQLLGRPFYLRGTVVQGAGRGHKIGFSTINLQPEPHLFIPKPGIYAGYFQRKDELYNAAISVGVRPTFESEGPLWVEAHLLDFNGNLYGEKGRLFFLYRLRDERRFDSVESLVHQVREDVQQTALLLSQDRFAKLLRSKNFWQTCLAEAFN